MSDDNVVEKAVSTSGNFAKNLISIIVLITMVLSLGINWGITTSELSSLRTQISEMKEQRINDIKEGQTLNSLKKNENDQLRKRVLALELSDAADREWKNNITKSLADIKTLLEQLRRRQ